MGGADRRSERAPGFPSVYGARVPRGLRYVRTESSARDRCGYAGAATPATAPEAGTAIHTDFKEKFIRADVIAWDKLLEIGSWGKAKELGALNYIGNEEYTAGVAGGERFTTAKAKNVLCVNTVPGAQNLEDRCKGISDGITKGGGKSTQLPLPASSFGNPTAVAEAIKATLLKDATIDGLVAISAADADAVAVGVEQASMTGKVQLGSFDMNDTCLERIKAGTQLFAIDQQPWLQGFLAVTMADAYVNYGLKLATAPILTGPGVVDSSNIDATLAGAKAGYR